MKKDQKELYERLGVSFFHLIEFPNSNGEKKNNNNNSGRKRRFY